MNEESGLSNIREKSVRSVFWVYFSNIILKGMGLIITLILAKILFPEDFGLIAIATVIIGFIQSTTKLGLDGAIIQRYKLDKEAISTCFFSILCMSLTMTLITILIAPYVSSFYESEQLTGIIRWLSLTILFTSIGMVPASLLEKKLSFKKKFFSEVIPNILYAFVTILLAFIGLGVMSIVFGQIIARGFEMLMVFILQPIRLVFKINKQIFKEMFVYGKELLILSYLTYFVLNFDNLFVGKILGTVQLGFYAVAYNIANFPATHITNVIHRVSFPFYAKVQKNKELLREGFFKIITFTCFFSIPLATGIIFFGGYILISLYNDKWLALIIPLQILSVMGFLRGIGANFSSFFCAIGKPKFVRHVTLLMVIIMIITIYPLTKWFGIIGTASCILLLAAVSSSLLFYKGIKELEITIRQIWVLVRVFVLGTAITMIVLYLLRITVFKNANILNVVSLLACAILVYLGTIYYFDKTFFKQIKNIKTYFQTKKSLYD